MHEYTQCRLQIWPILSQVNRFVYFKDSFNWFIKFICTCYESVKISKDSKNFELKYHIVVKKDTKRVIRAYKLKKDIYCNGQKKEKTTNKDPKPRRENY